MALLVILQDGCCTGRKRVGGVVQDLPPLLYPWQHDQQSKSFLLAFHTTSLSLSYSGNRTIPQPLNTEIQFLLCFWGRNKASSKGWAKGSKYKEHPVRNRGKSDSVAPRPGGAQTCALCKSSATGGQETALQLCWIRMCKMFTSASLRTLACTSDKTEKLVCGCKSLV